MSKSLDFILALIRKPKGTAAEYREALGNVDVKAAEAAVDELEAKRHSLLLKDGADAEIEALEVDIRAGNREVERMHAAKSEITRLLAEVEAREAAAQIEARAATARSAQVDGLRLLAELHDAAVNICRILDRLDQSRDTIREANKVVAEHGRADLKIPAPEYVLAEHLGLPSPESLPRFREWSLHGYRGRLPDGGVIPPSNHQLDRAKDLLAAPHRKAA